MAGEVFVRQTDAIQNHEEPQANLAMNSITGIVTTHFALGVQLFRYTNPSTTLVKLVICMHSYQSDY